MSKTFANLALVGALCIAVCGVASPGFAGPDDGKALVYLPAPASPASSTPCDRACLNGFVDKYFDALVSHCTCNVPFAPDVKYTENGERRSPAKAYGKRLRDAAHTASILPIRQRVKLDITAISTNSEFFGEPWRCGSK